MIGSWDRSMAGGANNASRLAHYCADKNFCTSFQSFNTCYKVREMVPKLRFDRSINTNKMIAIQIDIFKFIANT